MSAYAALLRDPRWQKKRLEVMQRDDFACRRCSDRESTLNVHHCHYKGGHAPWDYASGSLVTLCEPCHEYETQSGRAAKAELQESLCEIGYLTDNFHALAMAFADGEARDAILLVLCCFHTGRPMLEPIRLLLNYLRDKAQPEPAAPGGGNG